VKLLLVQGAHRNHMLLSLLHSSCHSCRAHCGVGRGVMQSNDFSQNAEEHEVLIF
jgi:hypothetical protein